MWYILKHPPFQILNLNIWFFQQRVVEDIMVQSVNKDVDTAAT